MKFLAAAALALASLTIATPLDTNARSIAKRSIPTVSGLDFQINGVTKYFAGTNAYWIGFLTNNADVDLVMTHLNSSGIKVLRVWGTKYYVEFYTAMLTPLRFQRHQCSHLGSLVPVPHPRSSSSDQHRCKRPSAP
jgi:hypothetical protein